MREDFKQRHKNNFYHELTTFGGYVFYILTFLFFLAQKNFAMSGKMLIGTVLIYSATILIRTFYFKDRPEKFEHSSYLERLDAASFPSLHAARSSFLSMAYAGVFNNGVITIIIAFLLLLVCYSRIKLKRHDWKDVAAGILIGFFAYFLI